MDTSNDEAIARLYQQEMAGQQYYVGEAYMDDSEDSDYERGKKKKRGKGGGKKGGKAAAATPPVAVAAPDPNGSSIPADAAGPGPGSEAADDDGDDDDEEGNERTESGRRRRKDVGKQRTAGRSWTDEEEVLFLQAMELHGRDWKRSAEVVVSRDHRAIASHAQKYFIKMCLGGKVLPPKVLESGAGYTLSGAMLDPYSAAAKSYGFKPELLLRLSPEELQTALTGLDLDRLPLRYGGRLPDDQEPPAKPPKRPASTGGAAAEAEKPKKPPKAPAAKKAKKSGAGDSGDDDAAGATAVPGAELKPDPDVFGLANGHGGSFGSFTALLTSGLGGDAVAIASASSSVPTVLPPPPPPAAAAIVAAQQQTEYARNRPRRELAGQRAQMGQTTESTQLVKCNEFQGLPASGAPLAQPFTVAMSSWALLMADFHAHLSNNEVIGMLGGRWDAEKKQLLVMEAYACRRAEGSDAATSVELDPTSQVEVQEEMERKGQKCVGWYHSHPVFEPSPSQKDMDNQRNYQALFRDPETKLEPFIGLIVGPFDPALPQPFSIITAFVVQQNRAVGLVPYFVKYDLWGTDVAPSQEVLGKVAGMLDMFKDDIGRTDFTELWRPFCFFAEDGTPAGPALTKVQKLRCSLTNFVKDVKDKEVIAQMLAYVCSQIQLRWGQPLDPEPVGGAAAQPQGVAAAASDGDGAMPSSDSGSPEVEVDVKQDDRDEEDDDEEEEEEGEGEEDGVAAVAVAGPAGLASPGSLVAALIEDDDGDGPCGVVVVQAMALPMAPAPSTGASMLGLLHDALEDGGMPQG